MKNFRTSATYMLAMFLCLYGLESVAKGGNGRLGLVDIGESPKQSGVFVSSNCNAEGKAFADCMAMDASGRKYSFFDGKLIRVSLSAHDAKESVALPGDLKFGEDIAVSSKRLARRLGVKFVRGKAEDGNAVFSSDFVVRARSGVRYSIELIADKNGNLSEIVERVNLP